jgi:hypothetical protein
MGIGDAMGATVTLVLNVAFAAVALLNVTIVGTVTTDGTAVQGAPI